MSDFISHIIKTIVEFIYKHENENYDSWMLIFLDWKSPFIFIIIIIIILIERNL